LSRSLESRVTSLDVLKATNVVTFNVATELNLGHSTLVVASSAAELAPIETKFDAGTQRASLVFGEELPAGSKAVLRIGFEAVLTDRLSGYYKSTWKRGTYALTQFAVREFPRHTYTG
jgi:aminopeptidase 2